MRVLIRLAQRAAILALGAFTVWLIVFVIFHFAKQRLPWIIALSATYAIGAYIILPYTVRMGLKILNRKRVPRFTTTADGLPGDPINIALIGDRDQLCAAFATAGWTGADRLNFASSWRMVRAFVFKQPYPTAPFSSLYLFGRSQDVGFQQAIDNSPRQRHHVRFWAKSLAQVEADVNSPRFWLNTDRPSREERVIWIGAGTRDIGFALTRLTLQMTHATHSDTNLERTYIMDVLAKRGVIGDQFLYRAGDRLLTAHVNHYITDGEVAVADLVDRRPNAGERRFTSP